MDIDDAFGEAFGIFGATLIYPHRHSGILLVCGSARCVWGDLEPWRGSGHDIMAVNDVGMHIPLDIAHWYSNSAEELHFWRHNRRRDYSRDFITHAWAGSDNSYSIDYRWPVPGHGTSSLNACYVGLLMGYERIILCGVPLDDSGHYFDPPWQITHFSRSPRSVDNKVRYWSNAAERVFGGRVKSMSGRTREILGEPEC